MRTAAAPPATQLGRGNEHHVERNAAPPQIGDVLRDLEIVEAELSGDGRQHIEQRQQPHIIMREAGEAQQARFLDVLALEHGGEAERAQEPLLAEAAPRLHRAHRGEGRRGDAAGGFVRDDGEVSVSIEAAMQFGAAADQLTLDTAFR